MTGHHLKFDATTGHLLYGDDDHLVYECIFTAAAVVLVVAPATLSATATHTARTYAGTSVLIAAPATLSATGTHRPKTYTGTSVLTVAASTLSAAATFAERTYTGTSVLTTAPATLSATATHAARSYTGTSVLTVRASTLSATALHRTKTYSATSTLTAAAATLSGVGVHPGQDCSIDLIASASGTRRSNNLLVWTTTEIGYAVYVDSDQNFVYRKTTDGGIVWSEPVEIGAAGVVASAVWYDQWTRGITGTTIHIWYANQNTDIVHYRALDTSTDTLGTQRTVYTGSAFNSVAGNFVSGAKMRGGNLLMCFGQASGETGTYRSTDSGATWGSRTDLVEVFTDEAKVFPGGESDNQDAWILYHDASADELTLKMHDDSANTNSESSAIMTVVDNSDENKRDTFAGAVRHTDNHLIVAALSDYSTSSTDFRVFDINGTASITEKTSLATDKANISFPSIYIDPTGRILVAYVGRRDGAETLATSAFVYYSFSENGGTTWSTDQLVSETSDAWILTSCAPSGPVFRVAWARLHGTGCSLWINCRLGEIAHTATATLTSAPATLSATAQHTQPNPGANNGIGNLTARAATLSATATHTGPAAGTNTGTSVLTARGAVLQALATFVEAGGNGVGTLIVRAATLSASATHLAKTYTGTSTLTAAPATLAASAFTTTDVHIGTSTLTVKAATLSASGTFAERTYTATSTLSVKAATLSANATHTAKTYSGTSTLTAGAATLSGTALFAEDVHTATSTLTAGAATLSATGTFTEDAHTATGTLTARAATLSAVGTFTERTYTATSALTVRAATLSAVATHEEPECLTPCDECQEGTTPSQITLNLANGCTCVNCATNTAETYTVSFGEVINPGDLDCSDCDAFLNNNFILTRNENLCFEDECCWTYDAPLPICGRNYRLLLKIDSITARLQWIDLATERVEAHWRWEHSGGSPNCSGTSLTSNLAFQPGDDGEGDCTWSDVSLSVVSGGNCQIENGDCGSCASLLGSYILTQVQTEPHYCSYAYEGSTACGTILLTITFTEIGINGGIAIDNVPHAQISFPITAPYNCSATRSHLGRLENIFGNDCNFRDVVASITATEPC